MPINRDLSKLFNEFIFECEYSRQLRPDTLRGYRGAFHIFNKLNPGIQVDTITGVTISQFFKTLHQRKRIVGKGDIRMGVQKSTIATYWSKLNGFFAWLETNDHIQKNPFIGMAYPTPSYDDKKYLSKDQVEKILAAILLSSGNNMLVLKRNLCMFYILLFCGLRKEELSQLQIRDLDFGKRRLTVRRETSKSNRTRQLPMHSLVFRHLQEYLKERKLYTSEYLFISNNRDEKLSNQGLMYFVQRIRATSGVKFHLHQVRHTFAVNFLLINKNIAKLQQLLGHTSIAMTLQYLRCLPPDEMKADIENMHIDSFA